MSSSAPGRGGGSKTGRANGKSTPTHAPQQVGGTTGEWGSNGSGPSRGHVVHDVSELAALQSRGNENGGVGAVALSGIE